jgi:hypothetical protein
MPRQTKSRAKASAGKRHPLNMRTTKETRLRLEKAAALAGRSLAQEVEARLERSFDRESLLPDVLELAYGSRLAALLVTIGEAMTDTGSLLGFAATGTLEGSRNWMDNPAAYDQARRAADRILNASTPSGEMKSPNYPVKNLGEMHANTRLAAVADPDKMPTVALQNWGRRVAAMLKAETR